MTNKNLKLAAMSVALTACVAAQPLVAHAVDAPAEPESKDADPKAALEEGADLKGQEENAPEGKDQVEAPVNQEADKKEQDPAFAPDTESKDVEIDYKDPQPDPKDPDTTITEVPSSTPARRMRSPARRARSVRPPRPRPWTPTPPPPR